MRFIDLASDGGCSKKASAEELEILLNSLVDLAPDSLMSGINHLYPDSGRFCIKNLELISSVDTLFPMVINPKDFGKIVINHVLGDIYSSFGDPKFALAHLNLPHGIDASNPITINMMAGALEALSAAGATLVGGHTLAKQTDLSLGFSIVASSMPAKQEIIRPACPGDQIFLTKPLGSSVASIAWKLDPILSNEFEDVLSGLLQQCAGHARVLHELGVKDCTDITGFGFVNHLYRFLIRQKISAEVFIEKLPIYSSVGNYLKNKDELTTSIYYKNILFAEKISNAKMVVNNSIAPILFDAQVAGPLVFTIPLEIEEKAIEQFQENGLSVYAIGRCVEGLDGRILLT